MRQAEGDSNLMRWRYLLQAPSHWNKPFSKVGKEGSSIKLA